MLDTMLQQGIIAQVGDEATEWCHPMVLIPKKKGGVRITADLTKLNQHVLRPVYPAPTREAVMAVSSESRFFSTLDAMMGYWQIPLAEEAQNLTTFFTHGEDTSF